MILSNTSKYGIRAVIYLSNNTENNSKIGIKKISEDLNMPMPFLGKILQILAKHKLLSSTKGPNGGFGLGRDGSDITLLDIVTILEGKELFDSCLISLDSCNSRNKEKTPCAVHDKFEKIRTSIVELFKNETIKNLKEELHNNKNLKI